MATALVPSALDRSQAFPVLTAAQIARIRHFGKVRRVEPGEILFEPGDVNVPFFVLLSGAMEIVQPDLRVSEREITSHAPGAFTGEMTMITGRGALVPFVRTLRRRAEVGPGDDLRREERRVARRAHRLDQRGPGCRASGCGGGDDQGGRRRARRLVLGDVAEHAPQCGQRQTAGIG